MGSVYIYVWTHRVYSQALTASPLFPLANCGMTTNVTRPHRLRGALNACSGQKSQAQEQAEGVGGSGPVGTRNSKGKEQYDMSVAGHPAILTRGSGLNTEFFTLASRSSGSGRSWLEGCDCAIPPMSIDVRPDAWKLVNPLDRSKLPDSKRVMVF